MNYINKLMHRDAYDAFSNMDIVMGGYIYALDDPSHSYIYTRCILFHLGKCVICVTPVIEKRGLRQ